MSWTSWQPVPRARGKERGGNEREWIKRAEKTLRRDRAVETGLSEARQWIVSAECC